MGLHLVTGCEILSSDFDVAASLISVGRLNKVRGVGRSGERNQIHRGWFLNASENSGFRILFRFNKKKGVVYGQGSD